MALTTEVFPADGQVKTFIVQSEIPSLTHVRVDFYYDDIDHEIQDNDSTYGWAVINNSIVFDTAPDDGYDVKITVSTDGLGLGTAPTDISNVAANIDKVINVSDNITTLQAVEDDLDVINNVDSISANITDVSSEPLRQSILDAESNATSANNAWDDFRGRYYGDLSTDPTTDPLGNPISDGDLYFNTTINEMRIYDGTVWRNAGSSVNGLVAIYEFVATEGQTVFTGMDYDVGFILVTRNGYVLTDGDFTADDGSTLTLATGTFSGDNVRLIAFGAFNSNTIQEMLDDIDANTTAIGNNTTAIGNNTTAIGNNTTAIGVNASAITTLDGRVTTVEDDITEIEANNTYHGIVNPDTPILSIGTDTTTFDIVAFDYWINGTKYSLPSQNVASGFTSNGGRIIGVNSSGLVYKDNIFFTSTELETTIEVGRMTSTDGSNIASIGDSSWFSDDLFRNLMIRFKGFECTKFHNGTARPTKNVTTPFTLDIEAGELNTANLEVQTLSTITELSGFPIYAVGGVTQIQAEQTPLLCQNTQYNDGGTSLQAIPSSEYVVHTLFRSTGTGQWYLEYGQETYLRLDEAISSKPTNTLFNTIGSDVDKIAKIVVQEGATEITQIIDIREDRHELVGEVAQQADEVEFTGTSLVGSQQPSTTDSPIQIEFGGAQVGRNATLATDGTITINEEGEYSINALLHFGRAGLGGIAELYGRVLINDVQYGSSFHASLDDGNFIFPHQFIIEQFFSTGDTVKFEMVRDSDGIDEGGLFSYSPNAAGWNNAPTATVTVIKHT